MMTDNEKIKRWLMMEGATMVLFQHLAHCRTKKQRAELAESAHTHANAAMYYSQDIRKNIPRCDIIKEVMRISSEALIDWYEEDKKDGED